MPGRRFATVVGDYYAMLREAQVANARQSLGEAQKFVDITQKLERGGEAAHCDSVMAETQVPDQQRDVQEGQLAMDKARPSFSVLPF